MTDIAVQAMEALHNCRCCLRRPPDKGLKTMYESVGKTEVYWEMLKQCFDIRLNLGNDECGICEVCVNRLRDANDFKNQVQQSQIDLKSLLERALAEKDKKPAIVKVEIVEDPISADEPLIREDPKKEFKAESDGDLVSNMQRASTGSITQLVRVERLRVLLTTIMVPWEAHSLPREAHYVPASPQHSPDPVVSEQDTLKRPSGVWRDTLSSIITLQSVPGSRSLYSI